MNGPPTGFRGLDAGETVIRPQEPGYNEHASPMWRRAHPAPGPVGEPTDAGERAGGVVMWNRAAMRNEWMPFDVAQRAFETGDFGIPKTQQIAVKLADGRIGRIDGASAAEAFAQGAQWIPDDEYHAHKVDEQGGAAEAGARAFARGALPSVPGTELGPDKFISDARSLLFGEQSPTEQFEKGTDLERAASLKRRHPIASGVGEVAGIVAGSALIPGGGMIGGAGNLAEHATSKLFAKGGDSLLRRVAARGAIMAARGSAEGIALASNDVTSEAALGDHDVNAEKLFAHVAKGALYGGLAGGAIGAAGPVFGAGLAKARTLMPEVPSVAALAEGQAVRALNPAKRFTDTMEKIPGGTKGVGRTLLDEGLVSAGDDIFKIAPKVAEARAASGKALGDLLTQADAAGFKGPLVADVVSAVERDVLPGLSKLERTNAGAVRAVKNLLADFETTMQAATPDVSIGEARATFKGLQEFRSAVDDLIKWNSSPLSPVNPRVEAFKAVRATLERELVEAGEKAAKEVGGEFKATYEAAKLRHRRLIVADQAAESAVGAAGANRVASPSDYISGAAGIMGGAALGGPGGALGGVAAGIAHHVVRTRGNSTAAVFLDRLANLGTVRRAADAVDEQIEGAISGFFKRAKDRARVKTEPITGDRHAAREEYESRAQAVRAARMDPVAAKAALESSVAEIRAHAPKTADALVGTAMRAMGFLQDKLPRDPYDTRGLPPYERVKWSDAELAAFKRYADAVDDPSTVLRDLEKGRLTPEGVDALKTVYPKLYAEVRMRVLAQVSSPDAHALPYQKRMQLGLLLDIPADPTLDPAFGRAMQASFHAAPAGAQHPSNGGAHLSIVQSTQTPFEAAERGR